MTKKEKAIQKALGTSKSFVVDCEVGVPFQINIVAVCNVQVDAVNKEEAERLAKEKIDKMSPAQRRTFVLDELDEELFAESNQADMTAWLYESLKKMAPKDFTKVDVDVISVDLDEDNEEESK